MTQGDQNKKLSRGEVIYLFSRVSVIKCNFERLKERFFNGRKYTPLYKKGIKETQNSPMETTRGREPIILNMPINIFKSLNGHS